MIIAVKPKTNIVRCYLKGNKTIQWTTSKGEVLFIEDMVDAHLNNSINMLARINSCDENAAVVLRCMRIERNKRQYNPDGEIAQMLEKTKQQQCKLIDVTKPFNFNSRV